MHHTPEKKPSDLRLPFWKHFSTHVLVSFQLFTLLLGVCFTFLPKDARRLRQTMFPSNQAIHTYNFCAPKCISQPASLLYLPPWPPVSTWDVHHLIGQGKERNGYMFGILRTNVWHPSPGEVPCGRCSCSGRARRGSQWMGSVLSLLRLPFMVFGLWFSRDAYAGQEGQRTAKKGAIAPNLASTRSLKIL